MHTSSLSELLYELLLLSESYSSYASASPAFSASFFLFFASLSCFFFSFFAAFLFALASRDELEPRLDLELLLRLDLELLDR